MATRGWTCWPCTCIGTLECRGGPDVESSAITACACVLLDRSPCLSLKASIGNLPERSMVTSMALVTFQNSIAVPMPLLAMITMLVSESSRYRKMISCSAAALNAGKDLVKQWCSRAAGGFVSGTIRGIILFVVSSAHSS